MHSTVPTKCRKSGIRRDKARMCQTSQVALRHRRRKPEGAMPGRSKANQPSTPPSAHPPLRRVGPAAHATAPSLRNEIPLASLSRIILEISGGPKKIFRSLAPPQGSRTECRCDGEQAKQVSSRLCLDGSAPQRFRKSHYGVRVCGSNARSSGGDRSGAVCVAVRCAYRIASAPFESCGRPADDDRRNDVSAERVFAPRRQGGRAVHRRRP